MAYRPSEGRNQKSASVPQQPNLVPIMNLFITIIPFLLLMVVISQVALVALNFSPAGEGDGEGEGGGGDKEQVKQVQVVIMATDPNSGDVFRGFEVMEEEMPKVSIPPLAGDYDFTALSTRLADIKARNYTLDTIEIAAYSNALYETLIQTIDVCRINGFDNIKYKSIETVYVAGRM